MKPSFGNCRQLLTLLALLSASSAGAGDITLALPTGVEVRRTTAHYQCRGQGPLQVEYVTAGAVSLAVMTLDGHAQVFAQVMSGSGARYASGPYVWWITGTEGSLQDLRKDKDTAPVSCKAVS